MSSTLLRATATLLTGSVVAHALPLLLGPALTRLYSPTEFGQFALLWALATNVAVVGCARYEFALPLEKTEPGAAELMALCARLLLLTTAGTLVAGGLIAVLQGMSLAWALPLAVLSIAATQWITLWATRSQRFGLLSIARLVQHGGGAVLQLALGLLKWGAAGLLAGAVAAGLVAAAALARPAPAGGWAVLWSTPWASLRAMATKHRDFPLLNTPHAFIGALQDTLTLIAVAAWAGDAAAGLWALSLRYLKAPATLLGGALSQALYPQLLQARTAGEARALVRKSMLALAAIALPMAAVLMLWGPWLFTTAFGAQWSEAGPLVRAIAPYIALQFIASPLSVTTLAWRAQAWALKLALVGQLAFFAGLLAGLALGGLEGAAWGLSASMLPYFAYYFLTLAHWKHIPDESLA